MCFLQEHSCHFFFNTQGVVKKKSEQRVELQSEINGLKLEIFVKSVL